MMANSAKGRRLDDPVGFKEMGFIPSGARLQNWLRGVQDVYHNTKGIHGRENMGERTPRSLEWVFSGMVFEREKRFSHVAFGMATMAIGKVANTIGTVQLAANIS